MTLWYFKRLFDAIRNRQFKPINGAMNTETYLKYSSSLGDNDACIYVEVSQIALHQRCRLQGTEDRMNVLAM